MKYPITPDGRYFVVRERLWRMSNPALPEALRQSLVNDLMDARRDVKRHALNAELLKDARSSVQSAKTALGERGPVWWTDGASDDNRKLAKNSSYVDWWLSANP